MSTTPSTKAAAKRLGATHYFTSKACPKGHLALRYVSTGGCSECVAVRQQRRDQKSKNCGSCGAPFTGRRCSCRPRPSRTPEQNAAHREAMKRWRATNPDRHRAYTASRHLQTALINSRRIAKTGGGRAISASLDELRVWYDARPRTCAICGNCRRLVIDHCHETGRLRGILCIFCNRLVGLLEKYGDRIAKARIYLE